MKSKSFNLILGLIFMIGTAGAFYWLWTDSKNYQINVTIDESLKPIEIDTVKNEATSLLANLENKSGIPIPTPTGKMGKENPFK